MTTTEPTIAWVDRLNPRNWSLAWKLVAIGLVPALLALALGVLRISDQANDAATLGTSNQLLQVRTQVAATADALRQERDEAAVFVAGGRQQDRGVLDIGIGEADAGVEALRTSIATTSDYDGTTRAALAQAETALAQLPALRQDVGAGATTTTQAVVGRYTGVVGRIDALDRSLLRQLRTPEVAGLADALTATSEIREQLDLQHTVLGAAVLAGRLIPADVAASQASDTLLATAYSDYRLALTPEQLTVVGDLGDGVEQFQRRNEIKDAIAFTQLDRPVVVDPALWNSTHADAVAVVQAADGNAAAELGTNAVAAEESASNLAGINSVILMLGLLAGITVAVLVARALIRSLRVLRTTALDVAERRLPMAVASMRSGETPDVTVDPVPLDTRDEVGQVARAFDAVHGQAVRLAADQAALQTNVSSMFVNLSRRSQALVERQLQLIEQLESNEQDPDQLSNLFQLDHLATRMRRNSENLLVLAGTDLAKRNVAPVPMVDVLRAAVSEIEQYQRIVVQAPPSMTIVGRAASDLVHLLAELLDNATNFSPPDSQVVMSTTRTADGAVLVEIADRGVGMIDYELADANQRLSGPSSVDVSASRRMGLFVVGRLGARHGVQVQLSTSAAGGPGAGLTASVTVPAALVPGAEAGQRAGGAAYQVPPQRAATPVPSGSLSALVTGNDGPAAPVFEQPERPPVNGSLPTRRPGSALQDGFGPGPTTPPPAPRRPDPADEPEPSVAERARQDQLDAERADAQRADRTDDTERADDASVTAAQAVVPDERDPDTSGADDEDRDDAVAPSHANGTNGSASPAALRGPWPVTPPSAGPAPADPLPQRRPAPADGARPPARPEPNPAIAPPTMPMPVVGRSEQPAEPAAAAPSRAVPPVDSDAIPPAESGADTLFSPRVPAPPDSAPAEEPSPFGTMPPRPTDRGSGFELGETTPIFEEIASAWFRSNRPLPVDWQDEQPAPPARPAPAARPTPPRPAGAAPQRPPAPAGPNHDHGPRGNGADPGVAPANGVPGTNGSASHGTAAPAAPGPGRVGPAPRPRPATPAEPTAPQTPDTRSAPVTPERATPAPPGPVVPVRAAPERAVPEPVASAQVTPEPAVPDLSDVPEPSAFATAADEGWRAAGNAAPAPDRSDELTSAGLPKRRPRARLVPGSAGSAVLAPPVSPARSAESVRGRLASYQQGVRQGRETKFRGSEQPRNGATDPAPAGGDHDEERP